MLLMPGSALLIVASIAAAPANDAALSDRLVGLGPGEPDHTVRVAGACPTFHWGLAPDQVDTSVDGFELVVAAVVEGAEDRSHQEVRRLRLAPQARLWTPSLADCLNRGQRYAWWIRPIGEDARVGDWSDARYFEVAAEPSITEVEHALRLLVDYIEVDYIEQGAADAGHEPLRRSASIVGTHTPGTDSDRDTRNGTPASASRLASPVDTSADHVALRGVAGSTGKTIGLFGSTASATAGSLGVVGHSTAVAGETIGVGAVVSSAAGTAGVFDNLAGGRILSGRVGGLERFVVSGAGEVTATTFIGDGSQLTAVDADLLDGLDASTFLTQDTFVDVSGDTMTGDLVLSGGANLQLGGVVRKSGELFLHDTGPGNLGAGLRALSSVTSGNRNTAVGQDALLSGAVGSSNTAVGGAALRSNVAGDDNTAIGREALYAHQGDASTAVGVEALRASTTGRNTAIGYGSLRANTTGTSNTAVGVSALRNNVESSYNTAVGEFALVANLGFYDQGQGWLSHNTAVGHSALRLNTLGGFNAAFGRDALRSNTTGFFNTAVGHEALRQNTTGNTSTAVGNLALRSQQTADENTAVGSQAGQELTTGGHNTALGTSTLRNVTVGELNTAVGHRAMAGAAGASSDRNTAVGASALQGLGNGDDNIALGYRAGVNLNGADSGNLMLGAPGLPGDDNTIRLGDTSHTQTYITGISGATAAGGTMVLVSPNGKLGTTSSSRRFKHEIHPLEDPSQRLLALRPVAFRYLPEVAGVREPRQEYGLIAEEVAKVLPDLVVHDALGQPSAVRYHLLIPMLLANSQRQHRLAEEQRKVIERQARRLDRLERAVASQRRTSTPRETRRLEARPGHEQPPKVEVSEIGTKSLPSGLR